jgi:hypothetical protein
MTTSRPACPPIPVVGQSSAPQRMLTSGEQRAAGFPAHGRGTVYVARNHAGMITLWVDDDGGGFRPVRDTGGRLAGLMAYWDGQTHAGCAEARDRARDVRALRSR